jgi:hypothetical protein
MHRGLFSDLEWRLIVAAQQASDKIDNIALNKPQYLGESGDVMEEGPV